MNSMWLFPRGSKREGLDEQIMERGPEKETQEEVSSLISLLSQCPGCLI